jgi:hypothetical protein
MSASTLAGNAMARTGVRRRAQPTTTPAADTLKSITAAIPSEVLTVYIAIVAALASTTVGSAGSWIAFYGCLIAAPVVVWVLYAGQTRAKDGYLPKSPNEWPRWEMFAATVAFAAWAFALPQSPFAAYSWYSAPIAGVVVLVAVTVLGLLAPVIGQSIRPHQPASSSHGPDSHVTPEPPQ